MKKFKLTSGIFSEVKVSAFFIMNDWIFFKLTPDKALANDYKESTTVDPQRRVTIIQEE
jgi:hypothetical protein